MPEAAPTPSSDVTPEAVATARSDEIMVDLQRVNKWYGEFHEPRCEPHRQKGERIFFFGPSVSASRPLILCINRSRSPKFRPDLSRTSSSPTTSITSR